MKIYKITNKINNMSYIGQTKQSLNRRFTSHANKQSNCVMLKRALLKYGKLNFTIEALFESNDQAIIDLKEKELIKIHNCKSPFGYNIKEGGRGHHTFVTTKGVPSHFKGKKHTLEARVKMTGVHKGKRRNVQHEFKGKQVIDIVNGYFWDSIKEAATALGIKKHTLARNLNGSRKNNTSLRLVIEVLNG